MDPCEFTAESRWDVRRFWTEDEPVAIGVQEERSSKVEYLTFVTSALEELLDVARALEGEYETLSDMRTRSVRLSDEKLFRIGSGDRITGKEIGDILRPTARLSGACPARASCPSRRGRAWKQNRVPATISYH